MTVAVIGYSVAAFCAVVVVAQVIRKGYTRRQIARGILRGIAKFAFVVIGFPVVAIGLAILSRIWPVLLVIVLVLAPFLIAWNLWFRRFMNQRRAVIQAAAWGAMNRSSWVDCRPLPDDERPMLVPPAEGREQPPS